MATREWLSVAAKVAQLETITVTGPVVAGEVWDVIINGKTISFTATTTTVAHVVAGLVALLNASIIKEFAEITWADDSPDITGTCDTAGLPFVCTVSTDSAGGSIATTTTTAATGPNHWDNANNWSGATVPITGDDVIIDISLGSILYGLAQSAVTLATMAILSPSGTSNTIGLPKVNTLGGYTEYRTTYLQISVTAGRIDAAVNRCKIALGSVQTSFVVNGRGSSADAGVPPILFTGTHASNAYEVSAGEVGFAFYTGESAVFTTCSVAASGNIKCGTGCTVGTITSLGSVEVNSAVTSITVNAGTSRLRGTGAVGTLVVQGPNAICLYETSGTLTGGTVGPGKLDCSADLSSRTFTSLTLKAGGSVVDPRRTITYTALVRGTDVGTLSAA